jgi:hypothetical protein
VLVGRIYREDIYQADHTVRSSLLLPKALKRQTSRAEPQHTAPGWPFRASPVAALFIRYVNPALLFVVIPSTFIQ